MSTEYCLGFCSELIIIFGNSLTGMDPITCGDVIDNSKDTTNCGFNVVGTRAIIGLLRCICSFSMKQMDGSTMSTMGDATNDDLAVLLGARPYIPSWVVPALRTSK